MDTLCKILVQLEGNVLVKMAVCFRFNFITEPKKPGQLRKLNLHFTVNNNQMYSLTSKYLL